MWDGEELDKCPLEYGGTEVQLALDLWNHYKSGFLPDSPVLLDNTALYCAYMRRITSIVNEHEVDEREKARRKAKHG